MADRSVLVKLIADNRSFDAAMASSGKSVEDVGKKATIAGDAATQAFGRIRTAAVSLIGFGVAKSGQDIINLKQQASIAFESITGSAEKASAAIGNIYKWDQTVPIPFENALRSGQMLAAVGRDVETLPDTLQGIADAVGGMGGDMQMFDTISDALAKIQSEGKLTARTMMQITTTTLPAWDLMASAMGISADVLRDQVSKNAIDADTAISKLVEGIEKRFPGAAQNLKDTTLGAFRGIAAGVRNAGESILEPLQGLEKQGAQTAKVLIESFGSGVGSTIQGLTPIVSGLTSVVGGLGSAVGTIPAPISAMGTAMLITHLASKKLESAGDTLAIRWMYAGDAVRGFSLKSMSASTIMTAVTAKARAMGASMLSAFGGPLGVAIIGATVAVSAWGDAQQKAKDKVEQHRAELEELRGTLDKVSGALTAATRAKVAQDWVDDGTVDRMKELGVNTTLAINAVSEGGPAMDAFKNHLRGLGADALEQSDYWKNFGATFEKAGLSVAQTYDFLTRNVGDYWEEHARIVKAAGLSESEFADILREIPPGMMDVVGVMSLVELKSNDVVQGSKELRQAFTETAAAVAEAAGVSVDKLVPALDAAKDSGGSVEDALKAVGITGKQAQDVIEGLGDYVMQGAGNFHVMAGAATGAGSAVKQAVDEISEAQKIASQLIASMVQQAYDLHQMVQNSLTSFIDPIGAWSSAVDAVNASVGGGGSSRRGSDPGVSAADAAVKAGRRRADESKRSAKAEQDAATKAAKDIRDARVAAAQADDKAARAAEKAARDRVSAAKREADDLRRLLNDQTRLAEDAEDRLARAKDRKALADMAVAAARQGLDAAGSPTERATAERILADALAGQAAATVELGNATSDFDGKSKDLAATKDASAKASGDLEKSEKALELAQGTAAKASEDSAQRRESADAKYTAAKEKADLRYTKSTEAVESMLKALIEKQDAARESARTMSEGAAGAVSGMVEKVKPSLADFMRQLEDQKKAQDDWAKNLLDLAKKLGGKNGDVVQYLAGLGPGAADMIAAMNSASVSELGKAVPLLRAAMPEWTDAITQAVLAGIPGVRTAFIGLSQQSKDAMAKELFEGKDSAQNIMARYLKSGQDAISKQPWWIPVRVDSSRASQDLRDFYERELGGASVPVIPGIGSRGRYARGGMVGDGWFTVGEEGPELGFKSGDSVRIFSNPESQRMIPPPASGGSGVTIVINDTSVTNYPIAEPKSVAQNRRLTLAGAQVGLP